MIPRVTWHRTYPLFFTIALGHTSACSLAVDPGHYGEGANEAPPALLLGGERATSQPTTTADTLIANVTPEGRPLGWSPQLALPQAGVWHGHASTKQVVAFSFDRMGSSLLATSPWNGNTIGSWTKQAGPDLPPGHLEAGVALTDAAIFLVGSVQSDLGDQGQTQVAVSSRNNSGFGDFIPSSATLKKGRFRATILECEGHLLAIGGEGNHLGDPVPVADYEFARLSDQKNSLMAFEEGPGLIADGRSHRVSNAAAVCAFGFVYVLGGFSPTVNETTDVVLAASFSAQGQAGAWKAQPRLPAPLRQAAVFVAGRRLLVAGGRSGMNAAASSKVISSLIGTDGSLGPWVTETAAALPDGWVNAKAVALKN